MRKTTSNSCQFIHVREAIIPWRKQRDPNLALGESRRRTGSHFWTRRPGSSDDS